MNNNNNLNSMFNNEHHKKAYNDINSNINKINTIVSKTSHTGAWTIIFILLFLVFFL